MSKRKKKPTGGLVTLAVPLWKNDLEEFRACCESIDSDPRDVIYGFIRAVNQGQIAVAPPSSAPMAQ